MTIISIVSTKFYSITISQLAYLALEFNRCITWCQKPYQEYSQLCIGFILLLNGVNRFIRTNIHNIYLNVFGILSIWHGGRLVVVLPCPYWLLGCFGQEGR